MKRDIWENCIFVDKLGLAGEFYGRVLPYTAKSLNKLMGLGWNIKSAQKKGNGHCFKKAGYFQLWINLKHGWFGIAFCPGKVLYGHNAYLISEAEFDKSVQLAYETYERELIPLFGAKSMDDFPCMACTRMDIANNAVFEERPFDDAANMSGISVIRRQGNGKLWAAPNLCTKYRVSGGGIVKVSYTAYTML